MFNLDTYIISDTHFLHANIVKYCNRPISHNQLMANNWHNIIKEDDVVLHLGDLMIWFNHDLITEAKHIAKALPGKKYILRGNHDKLSERELKNIGFTEIPEFIQEFNGKRILFSHYPDLTRNFLWDINIHGHIHNNGYEESEYLDGRYINVSVEVMDYKPVKLREILNV